MNYSKAKSIISFAGYMLICLFICLMQSTGLLTLQIKTASALLMLPAVIYAGYYFGDTMGGIIGFVVGALTDVYASTLCYNTIILAIMGFVCGFITNHYFNKNFSAAVVLNAICAAVYFFLKWLLLYAFIDPTPHIILFNYTLPSIIYTGALGILLYFPINPILKKIQPKD